MDGADHQFSGEQQVLTERVVDWDDSRTCKLSRFAGVSAAGARRRNPERSEGPQEVSDSRTCKPNYIIGDFRQVAGEIGNCHEHQGRRWFTPILSCLLRLAGTRRNSKNWTLNGH